MAAGRKLTLTILGNATGAISALAGVGKEATGLKGRLSAALPSFKALGVAGAAAFTAIAAASYKAVEGAAGDQKSQALLAKQLRTTTQATEEQIAAVEGSIAKMMMATGVADDELRPAFANLTRATGSLAKSQELLQLSMDISAATGKDLESVTIAMGKAATGNMAALSKLGVPLDESAKKSKDFNEIQKQLTATFSGASAAAADTFAGRLQRLRTGFGEIVETIGYALMPAFEAAMGFVTNKIMPAFEGFANALSEGGVAGAFSYVADSIKARIPQVIEAISKWSSAGINWLINTGLPKWAAAVENLAYALVDWARKAYPLIVPALAGFFDTVTKWVITTGLPWLVSKVQALGDALVSFVGEAARKLPAQLVTFLGAAAKWLLSDGIPILLGLGARLAGSLLKWTVTLGASLISGLGGAFVALVAALPDITVGFVKGLGNVAVSAVKWFISKFDDMKQALANVAIGAVNALIRAFNAIPLIPNIKEITIDTKNLGAAAATTGKGLMGLNGKFDDVSKSAKQTGSSFSGLFDDMNKFGNGAGAAGKQTDEAKKQLSAFASALKDVYGATKSNTDAGKAYKRAQDDLVTASKKVADAQQKFNLVSKGYAATSKEAIEATKDLAAANKRLRDANLAQEESIRGVAAAEKRLADLRAIKANPEDVAAAERDSERAKYGVEEANFAVLDAEKKLSEMRADPLANPIEIRKAEIDLAEAKLSVTEAIVTQEEAEKELAAQRNKAASPDEIADAERDLEAAKRAVSDATDEVTSATEEQSNAQAYLNEIMNGASESSDRYKEALKDLQDAKDAEVDATDRVTEAYDRQREAANNLRAAKIALDQLAKTTPDKIEQNAIRLTGFTPEGTLVTPPGTLTPTPGETTVINNEFTVNAGLGVNGADLGLELIDLIKQAERRVGSVWTMY